MSNQIYTFQDSLRKSLQDPAFKKLWEDSEPAYQRTIKRNLARLAKLSPHQLIKLETKLGLKSKTHQPPTTTLFLPA
jgi:hypothetical protein